MTLHKDESPSLMDIATKLQDREVQFQQFQVDRVTESNTVLSRIFRELALREAGLPKDDEAEQRELLQVAINITATLGLDRYVTVHEYRHETSEEVIERVKIARKEAGLSQTEFGKRTGLGSRFVLNRIENGKIEFDEETKTQIYGALGVDPLELRPTGLRSDTEVIKSLMLKAVESEEDGQV